MDRKEIWEKTRKEYQKPKDDNENMIEEVKRPLTEEEKKKVKGEMVFLIWGLIFVFVIFILIKIVPPLFKKEDEGRKVIDEINEESLNDGEIEINNPTIEKINNMFIFDVNNPLYEENILKLYNTEKIKIEDLDFSTKMFLITSNEIFEKYMLKNTSLKEYKTKEVILTKKQLDEIASKIFGRNIGIKHDNFKYFYEDNEDIVFFDALLNGDNYIFKVSTAKKSKIRVYTKLKYAYKVSNSISLSYSTLFTDKNGIYKDREMRNLISTDTTNYNTYFFKADSFEFNYLIKDNNYYLDYLYVREYTIK